MRISELAARAGVPVATVKFYLREKLLHDGVRTSATQARYDESHLTRLRLIRALLQTGGLSINRARAVVAAVAEPPESVHDLLGVATEAVTREVDVEGDHERVHDLLRDWGWRVDPKDCATHRVLEAALRGLEDADFTLPEGALDLYREHMTAIAEVEVAGVPVESLTVAVRYVVLGTVLVEPLLLVLRRMAQQEMSGRRFGAAPSAD